MKITQVKWRSYAALGGVWGISYTRAVRRYAPLARAYKTTARYAGSVACKLRVAPEPA